jgi:hypothetical protein
MSDLAAWHAANMVLDAVAPLANEARDAATRASPETRAYAQRLATCLDAERDRLVATARRLAPPQAQQAPSAPQARPSAPQHARSHQHARPVQEGML